MAFDITRVRIAEASLPTAFTFAAGKTAGNVIDFQGEDEKTVILFNNTASSAGTAVITAGTGIQGVADITVDVPTGFSAMVVESGFHKQTTGTNKGGLVIKPSAATITVAAVELR